jgi:hypothetical protein
MAISADPVLMLAGESRDWPECQACLDDWVPELLIARSDLIPREWRSRKHALTSLPVVIALRPATSFPHPGRRYNDLRVPADGPAIKAALDRAVSEVYERKAKELVYLIDCYVAGSQQISPYKKTVVVEQDGTAVEVPVSQIVSVVAARKQVEIQSTLGQFMLREPIHQIEEKLDPRWFVRIHRSVIVNLQYVRAGLDDKAVLLTDGSRHPVGPNYREALAEALRGSEDRGSIAS